MNKPISESPGWLWIVAAGVFMGVGAFGYHVVTAEPRGPRFPEHEGPDFSFKEGPHPLTGKSVMWRMDAESGDVWFVNMQDVKDSNGKPFQQPQWYRVEDELGD